MEAAHGSDHTDLIGRVDARAVGHGHAGQGQERRHHQEHEQAPLALLGGEGGEPERERDRDQPRGAERRCRRQKTGTVVRHAEAHEQGLERPAPGGVDRAADLAPHPPEPLTVGQGHERLLAGGALDHMRLE